jgi:hypothetical protein
MVGFLKRAYERWWEKYRHKPATSAQMEEYGSIVRTELRKLGFPVPDPPLNRCRHKYTFDTQFCNRPAIAPGSLCFWHLPSEAKYDIEVLSNYFGPDVTLEKALEDETKSGSSLSGAYLKNAPLGGNEYKRGVNLSGADMRAANLSGAFLSYGCLRGANLAFANLESAYLGDVDLRGCILGGARLFNAKLRNNDFTDVRGLEKSSFADQRGGIVTRCRMLEDYPDQAEPCYRALAMYFSSRGALDDASWAAYRYRVMHHRILRKTLSFRSNFLNAAAEHSLTGHQIEVKTLVELSVGRWISTILEFAKSCLYRWIFGYGEKPLRVALVSMVVIICYTAIYTWFGVLEERGFWTALYFSVVTFTTLGYGDLKPAPTFRLVAASEALAGLLLSGLFLFTLSRRAIGRS